MKKEKIVIIQREFPFYRKPLFERLLNLKEREYYLITGGNDSVSGGTIKINSPKHIKIKNIKIKIKNFEIWRQPRVLKEIKRIQPDIVIIEAMISNISNWEIIQLKKKYGFKLIAWACGYQKYTGKIKDFLLRKFFRNCDYFLAYHGVARDFLIRYGVMANKITILHNAVEVSFDYDRDKIKKIRSENLLKGKNVIIYVGRIVKTKQLEILLESMKKLGEDYVCMIVGGGDYLPHLKEKYKPIKNIRFIGEIINGIENYFKVADLFVLPGPGGLSLNEALYHGLPIISSLADGSAKDLVIDGYNGFLIKDITINKLTKRIRDVFKKGGKDIYSKNSLKLGKKFNFDNFVRNYMGGVTNCIGTQSHEEKNNYCCRC